MTSERVQFGTSLDDGEIFKAWAEFEHPQWPRLRGKGADWARVALRVLHAHHVRGPGVEWVMAKGRRPGKVLMLSEPEAPTHTKIVDVKVQGDDSERLRILQHTLGDVASTVVLRTAVHFLSGLQRQLAAGADVLVKTLDDKTRPLELVAIATDQLQTSAQPRGRLPLAPGISSSEPIKANVAARDANELFGVLYFVTMLNRFLAAIAAGITARAPDNNRKDFVEADYELSTLLERFWNEEFADGAELKHDLERELKVHQLLPYAWRSSVRNFRKSAEVGRRVVHEYLASRAARGVEGIAQALSSLDRIDTSDRAYWRDWTRSRLTRVDTAEGVTEYYREIAAPLEWSSVLHHMLRNRARGSQAMVAHDLQTWLIEAFEVRNRQDIDALADTCMRFNAKFYGDEAVESGDLFNGDTLKASDRLLTLKELLDALAGEECFHDTANTTTEAIERSEAQTPDDTERRKQWARFFYLWLNLHRSVKPVYRWQVAAPEAEATTVPVAEFKQIKANFRGTSCADVSGLRACVSGAQTAITGLDWILNGGIVPRPDVGRAWLIHGDPGSGKSTFALHLAADMARRGQIAIIICSEERASTVRERLRLFGLRDDARYEVLERAEFHTMLDDRYGRLQHEREHGLDEQTYVKGALVIFAGGATVADESGQPPKAELELFGWLESVSRRSREICKELSEATSPNLAAHRRWRWLSVIVDALDALELERPQWLHTSAASTPRGGLANLVQTIESCRLWGVLLCGNSNPHKEPLSYLADAVLELSVDDTRMQRVLTIHKCRAQPFAPGPHVLRLVEGVGVVLHPNLAALQQAARRFARRNLDSEHVIPAPEHIYWPRATNSNAWPPRETERLPDPLVIRRGAAVLLHGAPQSGKGPFLLNLMSERVRLANNPAWKLGANGGVLLVSFRGSERDALRPIEESRGLRNKWHANVSDLQLKWFGADDAMRAARVAHELVLRIRRCQRDGLPLTWIAFLGVDAVKTNLPAVDADKSFWPTILAITASEQISTAFVADEATGSAPFVLEHRQDMDYVLRFARQQNERVIEIEKSADPPPPEGYSQIAFDPVTGVLRVTTG